MPFASYPNSATRTKRLPWDYLVSVNQSWDREGSFRLQLFPAWLEGQLPVFPVPLRYEEPEVHLDLQYLFAQVYDSGPYRRGAVNYSEPAQPPLPEERQTWAAERVHASRKR
ncbi:MAG: DUF4058 family protein [Planctomycetota bacterium]|nr:MAG: DUF4058 family protein [Planctomycetota bacterium]